MRSRFTASSVMVRSGNTGADLLTVEDRQTSDRCFRRCRSLGAPVRRQGIGVIAYRRIGGERLGRLAAPNQAGRRSRLPDPICAGPATIFLAASDDDPEPRRSEKDPPTFQQKGHPTNIQPLGRSRHHRRRSDQAVRLDPLFDPLQMRRQGASVGGRSSRGCVSAAIGVSGFLHDRSNRSGSTFRDRQPNAACLQDAISLSGRAIRSRLRSAARGAAIRPSLRAVIIARGVRIEAAGMHAPARSDAGVGLRRDDLAAIGEPSDRRLGLGAHRRPVPPPGCPPVAPRLAPELGRRISDALQLVHGGETVGPRHRLAPLRLS